MTEDLREVLSEVRTTREETQKTRILVAELAAAYHAHQDNDAIHHLPGDCADLRGLSQRIWALLVAALLGCIGAVYAALK